MDSEIIKSLRNRSFIKGKQKTWVSELTDEQLWTIFLKIKNGETNMAIARHLQEKFGVMSESSTRSVSQAISKFKKRVSDISLLPTPKEIEEIGSLDGLKIAQKALNESIKEKGASNANLAKESKVLLEINAAIEKQEEKEPQQNNPDNFFNIAARQIEPLDHENTKKWVDAVLSAAEIKLHATYWVEIFYNMPDRTTFNRAREVVSNIFEKMCYWMKYERWRFNIITTSEDSKIEKLRNGGNIETHDQGSE